MATDFRLCTNVNCRYLRISVSENMGQNILKKREQKRGKSMSLVPACLLLDGDDLGAILASDEGVFPKGGSDILFTH